MRGSGEGMYNRTTNGHATNLNREQREQEMREIKNFVQQAFQEVSMFSIEQYLQFNSQISSEMFMSVMSILQERLPCSAFYFRQRRKFRQALLDKADDSMAVDYLNFDKNSR